MSELLDPRILTTLSRQINGVKLSADDIGVLPPPFDGLARDIGQRVNGRTAVEVFTELTSSWPNGEEIRKGVFQADPNAPSVTLDVSPSMPSLPDEAYLDPALGAGAGRWLEDYLVHARARAPMTPDIFHEANGLWLPSTAIARRLVVPSPFGPVYSNLMTLQIGETTIYHKTTGMAMAKGMAAPTFPHLLAAQDTTPEALMADMAGREPAKFEASTDQEKAEWQQERDFAAQRGMIYDEFSGLMASSGRDYNQGMIEAYMRFYDCDERFTRSTRGQGRVTVRNSYLSILGATTPKAIAPHLTSELLWSSGWWPRFGLLCPASGKLPWARPTPHNGGTALLQALEQLYRRLPMPSWPDPVTPLSVRLAPGVLERWGAYAKAVGHDLLTPELDERLYGTYGRMPTQVLKLATNLAAMDWPNNQDAPTIELSHLARGMDIAETWRASAHRVLAAASVNDTNKKITRLLYQVGRHGATGATSRELGRAMKDLSPKDIQDLLAQAIQAGEIVAVEAGTSPRGGRPTDRYRLATEGVVAL
jgi:hypothetical protein